MDSHHVLSTLFFFYVEEIRTDTRLFLGGGGRGSAGHQLTKTSTMTDPAAIERGLGTGASDTPGSSRA